MTAQRDETRSRENILRYLAERESFIRQLLATGVEVDKQMRQQMAERFDCKPQDIANVIYRIRNPKYWERHYATHQVASQNGRAQLFGYEGRLDPDDWKRLCEEYGNACASCGREGELVIDHVLPLAKGGTNTIDNIQPLCPACNRQKGTKHLDFRKRKTIE